MAGGRHTTAPASGLTSAVPPTSLDDIVAQAIADAVARFDTDEAEVVVLEARDVTWRDSSLGCPAPGISYLQRLTEGFLVVLRVGVRRVEYHSGPSGPARFCPDPHPPLPEGAPGFGPI
jgi:hypothetical protein